ncbi:hypothetical protein F4778DRAFT_788450 [Xylariomycetidae sp. FL2044]|nr:hypothetical protein F4778DRAFT_788450 [Xylariomycetidae sp. FL2044]
MPCSNGWFQCTSAQWELPTNFCCRSGQYCIVTAAGSTVLCCPLGDTCRIIEPLPCNGTLFDANLFPENEVHTTATTVPMEECGDRCCPFGYSCADGECNFLKDQSQLPGALPPPPPSSSSSSARPSAPTSSSINFAPSSVSALNPAVSDSSGPSTIAVSEPTQTPGAPAPALSNGIIAGITVGGFLGVVLLGAIAYLAYRLRRAKNPREEDKDNGNDARNPSVTGATGHEKVIPELSTPQSPGELDNTQIYRPANVYELGSA